MKPATSPALRTAAAAGLLLAASAMASTQSHAAPPPDPKSCEPGAMTQVDPSTRSPGTQDPGKNEPSTTGSARNENLSDKLARGDGVLCPPHVDPGMATPPPGGGKTPVIPPPGSPGGDPNVQPK
jgi:hypothetical protein